MYLKGGGCGCQDETDGKGVYLGPSSRAGFESVGQTKDHILSSLKKLELQKYFEDVRLIHHELTGIPPTDLSEEEDGLVYDNEKFTDEYNKHLAKISRKNFINLRYIPYLLLKWRGIYILSDGKMRTRTVATQWVHNQIMEEVFECLGWTFIKD